MIPVLAITTHNFLLWLGSFLGFVVLILLFVLVRIKGQSIAGRVTSMLDARAARIDAQLKMAEENQAAAEKARHEAEAEIAAAHAEAANIVGRAQELKGVLRDELAAAADADRDRIVSQARAQIESERNRAVMDLRSRAADVAIDAAREVLRRTVDERVDRDIISSALNGNGSGRTDES